MSAISYADVFHLEEQIDGPDVFQVGDLVRTGPNLFPHFLVIAISGETVWVRNVQSGLDALLPMRRCRKLPTAG